MNEKIMPKEMGVNKVSEMSTVSEVSKMSKQGEQQSLHSLLPLGEGGRRPDEGLKETVRCNSDEILKQVQDDGTRHKATEPASCKFLSWICSMLTETRLRSVAPAGSFRSLSGLTSLSYSPALNGSATPPPSRRRFALCRLALRPSANPLITQSLSHLITYQRAAFTLAEGRLACTTTQVAAKAAFTLAEVLITLAIIGIVAALTIPSLVQSYKERVTITKVKKAYTTLTNALQLAIIENGTVNNWGLTGVYEDEDGNTQISQEGSTKFARILSKYLNKSTICEGDIDCIGGYDQKLMNGDEYTIGAQGSSAVVLNDGTGVTFNPWTDNCENRNVGCGSIAIYTNLGHTAQYGVNTFAFTLYKDRIVPWGARNQLDPNNYFSAKCKYNGGNFENGLACTGWVIEVGNMDYLHCDGLSWDGKHSCKE